MSARARPIITLAMVGAASAACYSYVPVPLQSVESKQDVRLRLTDDATVRLSKDLGAFSNEIDGRITNEGPDSIAVGITIDQTYRGTTIGTTTQTLSLRRSDVVEVRKREFSRSRTAIFAAGTVVGFGVLAAGITQLVDPNGPSDNQTTPPPPPSSPLRRPFTVRVRIPIP